MNGFDLHSIAHTSASSINSWANAPDVWIAERLFGLRRSMSPAAARGRAVEHGVAVGLRGESDEAAARSGEEEFYAGFPLRRADPDVAAEGETVGAYIRQALSALRDAGLTDPIWPDADAKYGQHAIDLACRAAGWRLPVHGYLDFLFGGVVVDLKTTKRMPTTMTREHQRQRAIYARAMGNHAVRFLYVTPQKAAFKEDGETADLLAEIKTILTRQERFLRLGDREHLRAIVPVKDSFYWTGALEHRRRLYGL